MKYPLRANGYTKQNNISCRVDDRDCLLIEKARKTIFEIDSVRELFKPELVSSVHGAIKQILFILPDWIFKEHGSKKCTALLQYLLKTLSLEAQILIIINEQAQDKLKKWIEEFNINAKIISLNNDIKLSIWAEDSFCVSNDLEDQEQDQNQEGVMIEPRPFLNIQKDIADIIAERESDFEAKEVNLYFEGGNMLIGDNFWLIGVDSINKSIAHGCVKNKIEAGESELEATIRLYGLNLDQGRELHIIGSSSIIPKTKTREIQTVDLTNDYWKGWREILYKGNDVNTEQPIFHIDMFLSLAGRNKDNKYQILVGSPKLAAEILDECLPEGNMQEIFDEIANILKEKGFEVIRNPMPLIYDDNDEEDKKIREWYFASANNVLIRDQPTKKVWLPTYGYDDWKKLQITDDKNKEIWESLGYEVLMLPDCHFLAAKKGVVHCISKYLSRYNMMV